MPKGCNASFLGQWETSRGRMTIKKLSRKVSGTYSKNNGTFTGWVELRRGEQTGDALETRAGILRTPASRGVRNSVTSAVSASFRTPSRQVIRAPLISASSGDRMRPQSQKRSTGPISWLEISPSLLKVRAGTDNPFQQRIKNLRELVIITTPVMSSIAARHADLDPAGCPVTSGTPARQLFQ